ncbi:hypothetical protein EV361DRAFT_952331 [Lentinula raphanica]|nr:hypothetical protein EV361DRAFT_952331 [Lentinula raphanica]
MVLNRQIFLSLWQVRESIPPAVCWNESFLESDHYKTQLNNYAQGARLNVFFDSHPYGSEHAPIWRTVVYINKEQYGFGEGSNKRAAEENAAFQALGVIGILEVTP